MVRTFDVRTFSWRQKKSNQVELKSNFVSIFFDVGGLKENFLALDQVCCKIASEKMQLFALFVILRKPIVVLLMY